MNAEEVSVNALFGADKQFLIPPWQRRYSWEGPDWEELWRDLERVRCGEATSHFVGSIVLSTVKWSGLPSEAHRYVVVDGQQRISTLTLLVCAVRDRLAAMEQTDEARAETVRSYTAQLLRNTNLKPEHQERLVLQEADAGTLRAIVDGTAGQQSGSLVERCYRYFMEQLGSLEAAEVERVLTVVLADLTAVWVTLEPGDNAHRVFQTLNAGGKPLRQLDLVRNYFFLLLGTAGDKFYRDKWRHLENGLAPKELDEYLVAWSISQGHTGGKGSLFRYFQRDLLKDEEDAAAVSSYGASLVDAARLFDWIRRPESSPLKAARQSLIDLRNWGTLPAEGLILHLLRSHADDVIGEDTLARCLEYTLSFMARRTLGGFEPQLHKSIFVSITLRLRSRPEIQDASVAEFLRLLLSVGEDVRTWPSDELINQRVESNTLYTKSRAQWSFSILERINRELYDYSKHAPKQLPRADYTVEHVMPQTLTPKWLSDLSNWGVEDVVRLHQTRLHVLGNLTLSPINSELSNKPFVKKQSMVKDDWLRLNKSIADAAAWTDKTIDERSLALAALAEKAFAEPMSASEIAASSYVPLLKKGSSTPEAEDIDDEA